MGFPNKRCCKNHLETAPSKSLFVAALIDFLEELPILVFFFSESDSDSQSSDNWSSIVLTYTSMEWEKGEGECGMEGCEGGEKGRGGAGGGS